MSKMAILGIEQIFTSYDNPKGNAETERMMRTIKEEVIWLHEFTSLTEAKEGSCLMTSTLKWAKICPPWRGALHP